MFNFKLFGFFKPKVKTETTKRNAEITEKTKSFDDMVFEKCGGFPYIFEGKPGIEVFEKRNVNTNIEKHLCSIGERRIKVIKETMNMTERSVNGIDLKHWLDEQGDCHYMERSDGEGYVNLYNKDGGVFACVLIEPVKNGRIMHAVTVENNYSTIDNIRWILLTELL